MHLILTLLYLAATILAVLVPKPTGPYSVALKTLSLTDTSRLDPYATSKTPRRILLSAFLPVPASSSGKSCPKKTVPYMSPAVAEAYGKQAAAAGLPNSTFAMFEITVCDLTKMCGSRASVKRRHFPLVLYSPGLGASRELYGARARSLASQGYAVVTIDHPYDAVVVEFPDDGTVIPAADIDETNTTQLEENVDIRRQDMSFALDQLGDSKTRRQLLYNYPHSIDLSQVAAIGYSIGGAAAAAAVASDNRILGGLNMDGRLFDPVLSNGLSKPFMQIGRPGHKEQDSTWDQFWSHLRGPAIELSITGTTHGSYPDTLSLLSALDLPHVVWDMLKAEYGAIDPRNMEEDLDGALTAFLQFLFTEEKGPLADIHESFPDINIVRSKLAKY